MFNSELSKCGQHRVQYNPIYIKISSPTSLPQVHAELNAPFPCEELTSHTSIISASRRTVEPRETPKLSKSFLFSFVNAPPHTFLSKINNKISLRKSQMLALTSLIIITIPIKLLQLNKAFQYRQVGFI